MPQAAVDAALAGLNDAATQWYGTGARIKYDDNDREPIITAPHVKVHAKTGTAQAPPRAPHGAAHGPPTAPQTAPKGTLQGGPGAAQRPTRSPQQPPRRLQKHPQCLDLS